MSQFVVKHPGADRPPQKGEGPKSLPDQDRLLRLVEENYGHFFHRWETGRSSLLKSALHKSKIRIEVRCKGCSQIYSYGWQQWECPHCESANDSHCESLEESLFDPPEPY